MFQMSQKVKKNHTIMTVLLNKEELQNVLSVVKKIVSV